MLTGEIGDGITVVRTTSRACPDPGLPSELNRVWTNLIDNAVSAMDRHGTLTVRTALEPDQLLVEFADTGPGVPDDVGTDLQPFFTPKPARARHGHLLAQVVDEPMQLVHRDGVPAGARLQVRLPLTVAQDGGSPAATGSPRHPF
jgi:signal transduction histidine kinase